MSLFTIASGVVAELGINLTPGLFNASSPQGLQLVATAQAAGQALYRAHNWTILHREHVFETIAGEENYAVPADFGRIQQQTAWDRAQFRAMRGNLSPADWQRFKSGLLVPTGIVRNFRLLVGPRAGSILIDPAPTVSGQSLVYEYVSAHWCESAGGAGQAALRAETDEIRLDEELFRLALAWRLKRALGMAYADDRMDYERELKAARQADLALPVMSMIQREFRPGANTPEGSWNA